MVPSPKAAAAGPPPLIGASALWATAAASGAVFVLLALVATAIGTPNVFDRAVRVGVAGFVAVPDLRWAAYELLSAPGHIETVLLVVGATVVGALVAHHRRLATIVLLGGTVGLILTPALKHLFDRARPTLDLTDSFAFPSGHSTRGVLIVGLAVYAVWCFAHARAVSEGRPVLGRPAARGAIVAWLGLALMTGLGRILSDVHWATDVLGGWSLGLMLLALSVALHRRTDLLPTLQDGPGLHPETGSRPSRAATPRVRA